MLVHQRSALEPFLFAVVANVIVELEREGVISESLHVDNLALMNGTFETIRICSENEGKFLRARVCKITLRKATLWSVMALERMDWLKIKLTHLESAA